MPFPSTVRVSRRIPRPPGDPEALLQRLAGELRREGVRGVSTGHDLVRFGATDDQRDGGAAEHLMSSGEVEVLDRGHEVELVAEADISRIPLAFGTATLFGSTLVGGFHAFSITGGLVAGALISLVPWAIARYRLGACLRRVAGSGGPTGLPAPGRDPHH